MYKTEITLNAIIQMSATPTPFVEAGSKIREGVEKNRFIWDFVPNFLVKITIQLFLLQTSRNVLKHVIHKWEDHIWPFHDALRPQRL